MVFIDEAVHLVGHVHVLDGRGDFVFLFIAHLADDVSEVLAGTGLGQSGDDVAGLETSHWADVFPDQTHTLLSNRFRAVPSEVLRFDGHKCDWDFSLDLVMHAYDDGLCDFAVFHQDFLHLTSRKTMAGSVNHIILSGHDMEVPIFIVIA